MKAMSLIFCAAVTILMGTTYYVDQYGAHGTVGNDNYSGQSWGQPWATITKAAQTIVAGDSVMVAAGIYREQVLPLNNGTLTEPIVYFTNEAAEVTGGEPVIETQFQPVSGYPHIYKMFFPAYEILSVTQLAGDDTIAYRPYCDSTKSRLSVENCRGSFWHDQTTDTIYLHTNDGLPPDSVGHDLEFIKRQFCLLLNDRHDIEINGFVLRNGRNGVNIGEPIVYCFDSRNIRYQNLRVFGGGFTFLNTRNLSVSACSVGNGVVLGTYDRGGPSFNCTNVDTAYVYDVQIFDAHNVGFVKSGSSRIMFEKCRWWHTHYLSAIHGFMVGGGGDETLRNTHITFRNCVGGAGCQEGLVFMYSDTVAVENCDLKNFRVNPGENSASHSTAIRIWNSILHTGAADIYMGAAVFYITPYTVNELICDYNCIRSPWDSTAWVSVSGTYYDLAGWRALSGQDQHSITLDPRVVDNTPGPGHPWADYHLQASSPGIDAGDPSYPVPPNGGSCIDIGAYEYAQTAVQENKSENIQLLCYPNPFMTSLCIKLSKPRKDEVTFKLTDSAGRTVFAQVIDPSRTNSITPSALPEGVYFAMINEAGIKLIRKVVLLRSGQ